MNPNARAQRPLADEDQNISLAAQVAARKDTMHAEMMDSTATRALAKVRREAAILERDAQAARVTARLEAAEVCSVLNGFGCSCARVLLLC